MNARENINLMKKEVARLSDLANNLDAHGKELEYKLVENQVEKIMVKQELTIARSDLDLMEKRVWQF